MLPNYLSDDFCDQARQEIDDLILRYGEKIWVDKEESDHRVFGADRASNFLDTFYSDPFLRNVGETYLNQQIKAGFLLAARLSFKEKNLGSGGGWHRDTAGRPQFKSIAYLSDVAEDNGPFQYLKGTNKSLDIISRQVQYSLEFRQMRFENEEVSKMLENNKSILETFDSKKGTVLLVDTRGIHRGMPIMKGNRYALTNYFWTKEIPTHMRHLLIE